MVFEGIQCYHNRLRSGHHTVRNEVLSCLERIRKHETYAAFLEVYAEEALNKADALDAQGYQGNLAPLTGVVIGVKDNICHQNHRVSAGSRILEGFVSLYSATVVQRLEEAGAVIIGRLNCDEFAMGSSNENSAYGPVRNPWDPERVPGGSSGGSAAAVAFGGCHLSLGTDTGGSVRQPASFCGVVGIKPTYGRVSRHGIVAFGSSFDQVGVFGERLEDAVTLLSCISGADDFDATCTAPLAEDLNTRTPSGSYRVGYNPEWLENAALSLVWRQRMEETMKAWQAAGHTLVPLTVQGLEYAIPIYYILATAEASSNLSRYAGMHYGFRSPEAHSLESTLKKSRSQGFGPEVQRRILLGTFVLSEGYYDAYYAKAQKVRRQLKDRFDQVFESCDAFVLPTTVGSAFKLGEKSNDPLAMYLEDQFTVLANLTGLPALSIPFGPDSNGMPLGLQFMGPSFGEASLFEITGQLQNLVPISPTA
ncbi:MAG: Asp-tRNA(Asn)/Glu-tRNA(Gln) amidotransferase subunit GatA [Bacteroidota bacterium]